MKDEARDEPRSRATGLALSILSFKFWIDWFRCVDYVVEMGTESVAKRRTTETTRRDQLFLKMLGVQ